MDDRSFPIKDEAGLVDALIKRRRPDSFSDQNFVLVIKFEGPWERLSGFLCGLRRDGTLRWDIPADPKGVKKFLSAICGWCDRRDALWRAKLIIKRKKPRSTWKRRAINEA